VSSRTSTVRAVSPRETLAVAGSVSWLRAYPTPGSIPALHTAPDDGELHATDPRRLLVDGELLDGDDNFWDVQALRRGHVSRVLSRAAVECRDPGSEDWVPVETHLVLHEAGLALIRLTFDPRRAEHDIEFPDLARYSDAVWGSAQITWRISLAGESWQMDAGVRDLMDMVMLPMHECFCGRTPDLAAFRKLTTFDERYTWLEGRVAAGELLSPYPVTFGTAYELVWHSRDTETPSPESLAELACDVPKPLADTAFGRPADTGYSYEWFIGENRSVLALVGPQERTQLGAFDALRIQTLEYLTLQRAALRTVQRGTQQVITEQGTTTRRKLQQWQRLVSAFTDDYVLHDRIGAILGPVRRYMRDDPQLRDPGELEEQVQENLSTFGNLLDAAGARVAIVLSGLFGVVAAITLVPLAREIELAVFKTRGTVETFSAQHLILSIGLDVCLLIVVGTMSALIIRRANLLRPKR
jgi:hypothetical protein